MGAEQEREKTHLETYRNGAISAHRGGSLHFRSTHGASQVTPRRGELVRERRRLFGLPLPIADKVLPFRPGNARQATRDEIRLACQHGRSAATDPFHDGVALAEQRVVEAFAALQEAELRGAPKRTLDRLDEAHLAEMVTYQAAFAEMAPTVQ
jgi:hypothetical protein